MTYTASVQKQAVTFSGLVNDGNRIGMTGYTGSVIQTIDATGTPVTSPATVNTTQTLVVPSNAVSITVASVTNAVRVSEDSTSSAYFAVPAGVPVTFDVSRQQNVYLSTAGSTVVSFYFSLI